MELDNQGIKEKINQNNQTGKAADQVVQLRKTRVTADHGGGAGCGKAALFVELLCYLLGWGQRGNSAAPLLISRPLFNELSHVRLGISPTAATAVAHSPL